MLSRIIYRIVSIFFFLGTITCWVLAATCVVGLIAGYGPKFFFLGLWSGVLAFLLGGAARMRGGQPDTSATTEAGGRPREGAPDGLPAAHGTLAAGERPTGARQRSGTG